MNFISVKIKVSDLFNGYEDNGEKGVVAYGGKLNVRPAYQREFIYNDKEKQAVITSIISGFPLNTFYWATNADGTYELMDGQQRTRSILEYLSNVFSIQYKTHPKYARNIDTSELHDLYLRILNYELQVYICTGTPEEKLDWFRILNTQQKQMTEQELRNAAYTGPWLSNAKSRLSAKESKDWCKYVSGNPIRQEILEIALNWVGYRDKVTIEVYMAKHQADVNADDLCDHFTRIINWIKGIFVNDGGEYRKEMKLVDWGDLYHKCHGNTYQETQLRIKCDKLMQDDDVTCKKGIYSYLLLGEEKNNERFLNIREFTESQKRTAYDQQRGICPICKNHFEINDMQGDHKTAWSKGGKTELANLQMLCSTCNNSKSNH